MKIINTISLILIANHFTGYGFQLTVALSIMLIISNIVRFELVKREK